jgi:hypothetical protein
MVIMVTEVTISHDQNKVIIDGQLLDFYPVKRVKKIFVRRVGF